jgi:uncharacterized membrane protein YccC
MGVGLSRAFMSHSCSNSTTRPGTGTTAAIVCQPRLDASLRKGRFRMIDTPLGAVAIVVLTACFPQYRCLFAGMTATVQIGP